MHDPGKYRGITLLSQVLKLPERVLDAWIRRIVECDFGENSNGSGRERGTADGMYVLRQMVEKILEVQGSMALGFVDLAKAFDQRDGDGDAAEVPEAEARMVDGTYEKTTARLVVGEGASDEFEVKIGLKQDSVQSPLLFISVLDLISRKTAMKDAMKKLLYADDLALVATGDTGGVERAVYLTRAEDKPSKDGSAAHRQPEGGAGHRAGGEGTDSGE